jgi:hypothetical protein
LDTGSLITLTPILSDFVGPLVPTALTELKGLTSTTNVVGQGVIEWPIFSRLLERPWHNPDYGILCS